MKHIKKAILDLFVESILMQFDSDLATEKDNEITDHLNYTLMAD
jgi:hypothetical protein